MHSILSATKRHLLLLAVNARFRLEECARRKRMLSGRRSHLTRSRSGRSVQRRWRMWQLLLLLRWLRCLCFLMRWHRWHRNVVVVVVDFVQRWCCWWERTLQRAGRSFLLRCWTLVMGIVLFGNGFDHGLGSDGAVALRNRNASWGYDFVRHSDVDGFRCLI